MGDNKYFRIQMNNAITANGKNQLQLNMCNDKNAGFVEKWEVKLLIEK